MYVYIKYKYKIYTYCLHARDHLATITLDEWITQYPFHRDYPCGPLSL